MALESGGRNIDNVDQVHDAVNNQEKGEEKKTVPISFGFNKTSTKFKPSSLNRIEPDKEDRDYLTGVEENELKSTKPVEQPRELIIPLINKNRAFRQDRSETGLLKRVDIHQPEGLDSVDSQAVKELIEESRQQQEKWKNDSRGDPNLTIPLLMQNSMLQSPEDGEKVNVEQLPESSTEADYERVPVESFGMAMLKGMGWKEGEGIGLTFKEVVKPIEHKIRPKGLGLGADRSALQDLQPSGPRRPLKPGEERPQEELVLGKEAFVLLLAGAHKDHYGQVEGVDADNARVMVKLAIGGKNVTVSQYSVRLVNRKEYEKNAKDLSRHSKAYKDAEREKERKRERENEEAKEREKDKKKQKREVKEKDQRRSAEKELRKQKHQDSSYQREKPPPEKYARQTDSTPSWLQRDLRVRFIDKSFKGGKYYNSKMTVEDVLTPGTCVCRTEEGRLLDDVKQAMLETMVPKNASDSIMVVLGEHRGQVGQILQRDRERCQAMVQLDRYGEKIYTLDYDSICHYVGGDCM